MCGMRCRYRACWIISFSIEQMLALFEYRGILISLDAVVLLIWALRYCPIHWQYSQLVVRSYTVRTYDLYMKPRSITYTRKGTIAMSGYITRSRVYTMYPKKTMVYTCATFSGFIVVWKRPE